MPTPATPATPAAPAAPAAPANTQQSNTYGVFGGMKQTLKLNARKRMKYRPSIKKCRATQIAAGLVTGGIIIGPAASIATGTNILEGIEGPGMVFTETVNYVQNVVWPQLQRLDLQGAFRSIFPNGIEATAPAIIAGVSTCVWTVAKGAKWYFKHKRNKEIKAERNQIYDGMYGGGMTR